MSRKPFLTTARKRFISSLAKNLILVGSAAAFGGEYLFRLSGRPRVWFLLAVGSILLVLFWVGVALAVDGEEY